MDAKERRAGRMNEIQQMKIELRNIWRSLAELRTAEEPPTPAGHANLVKAEDAIDVAIARLNALKRTDL